MNGTRRKIHEERFIRGEGLAGAYPLDGFFRKILGQMVRWVVMGRLDGIGIVDEAWFILGCFSSKKAIKVVKSQSCWPVVERSDFSEFKSLVCYATYQMRPYCNRRD
jgi:hypothetical protein